MLIQKRGNAKIKWFPKVASTRFDLGDAVSFNQAGAVTPSLSSSTTILGFIKKDIRSTDTDYASTTLVPVQVLDDADEVEIDASTTVTSAMVGTMRDLSNASTLNVGAGASLNHFRVLSIGSTTSKAVVSFVKNALSH